MLIKAFRQHLVVQLGLAVSFIALGVVAFLSLLTYTTSRDTLSDQILSQVANTAEGLEVSASLWLSEQRQDLELLLASRDLLENASMLLSKSATRSEAQGAYSRLQQVFENLVRINPEYREILLLSSRAGEVLATSDPEHQGSFQQDSRFFIEGLKGLTVQPVYYWPQTLEPTMSLAVPIRNSHQESLGVLAVHLDMRVILEQLRSFPTIAHRGKAYLVDANRVPVGVDESLAKQFPRGLHTLGVDAVLRQQEGVRIYDDMFNQRVVGGYRWLEGFNLGMMVEIPLREAFAPARQLGWNIFFIGCVGTLLISFGLILLARRTILPVLSVAQSAQRVATGDLDVSPVPPARAEIGVLVNSFNDMVARIRHLLDEVRDREERYHKVFNATGEAIFVRGEHSQRVLDYNEAARRIYRLEEGEDVADIVELSAGYPPYAAEDIREKMQAARDEGLQVFEWRSRRRDGELFWSEVSLSKMTVGDELCFLAVVRDIDQRKRNEAELEEYRKNLEWTIEDRSQQLQEAQEALVNKEKLAVLGQLTATVSHELRNPLGTMSNALYALEAALDLGAIDKARKSLEMVDRNVRRCDKIIGELLDFTRRHENEIVATKIDNWLQGMLEEYRLPEGFTLQEEFSSGAQAHIDRESMRRAMINLLDNAVQAMQADAACGKLLTVGTFIKDGELEIRISDQGPGIPEENRQAIFEPLFSTKEFGVGLGVPIIQNVVEKHGGRLDYYCPPGGGTVAIVTLPLRA